MPVLYAWAQFLYHCSRRFVQISSAKQMRYFVGVYMAMIISAWHWPQNKLSAEPAEERSITWILHCTVIYSGGD